VVPSPRGLQRDADATPARSWRSGAGQYALVSSLGSITRFRAPVPGARRPSSVAATAGARMGMRGGRRALHPWSARQRPALRFHQWPRSGNFGGRSFAGMLARSLHARGAGVSGDTSGWPIRAESKSDAPPNAVCGLLFYEQAGQQAFAVYSGVV